MSIKILIVEDDRIVARDLQQRLLQSGYEVVGIADCAQVALALIDRLLPDLILLDIRLKGEANGIDIAHAMRQFCPSPIVFLTAYADPTTLEQVKATQPYGYLVKPVTTPGLRAAIEIALIRYQTEQSLRQTTGLSFYQVGGSLRPNDACYVVRQADADLYQALSNGELCYVFNARQMGKSSLRVRVKHHLTQQGHRCAAIDLSHLGSAMVTPNQWYKGLAVELFRAFELGPLTDFQSWWRNQEGLSPIQQLNNFIEDVILTRTSQGKVFIFIDEIDSVLSLPFSCDDFFALLRSWYNQRADQAKYNRLTIALFGVATPSELVRDRKRTPLNLGQAIELQGFQLQEAMPLCQGFPPQITQPEIILEEILHWTQGQPFLTQKICRLFAQHSQIDPNITVTQLIQHHILENWETHDEPEHLKSIRDRILNRGGHTASLLTLYLEILKQGGIRLTHSSEQTELMLSGLVINKENRLVVRNPIYQRIFNQAWVEKCLPPH